MVEQRPSVLRAQQQAISLRTEAGNGRKYMGVIVQFLDNKGGSFYFDYGEVKAVQMASRGVLLVLEESKSPRAAWYNAPSWFLTKRRYGLYRRAEPLNKYFKIPLTIYYH